jgi:hypothetical protein
VLKVSPRSRFGRHLHNRVPRMRRHGIHPCGDQWGHLARGYDRRRQWLRHSPWQHSGNTEYVEVACSGLGRIEPKRSRKMLNRFVSLARQDEVYPKHPLRVGIARLNNGSRVFRVVHEPFVGIQM